DELAYEHVQAIMLANSLVPEEKRETLLDLFYSKRLRGIDLSALYYLVAAMMKNGPRARRLHGKEDAERLAKIILLGIKEYYKDAQ
ncbi:MAG: hypothetical protein ACI4Q7_02545, partial [Candidatus Avelusimicrobium sp.]